MPTAKPLEERELGHLTVARDDLRRYLLHNDVWTRTIPAFVSILFCFEQFQNLRCVKKEKTSLWNAYDTLYVWPENGFFLKVPGSRPKAI